MILWIICEFYVLESQSYWYPISLNFAGVNSKHLKKPNKMNRSSRIIPLGWSDKGSIAGDALAHARLRTSVGLLPWSSEQSLFNFHSHDSSLTTL